MPNKNKQSKRQQKNARRQARRRLRQAESRGGVRQSYIGRYLSPGSGLCLPDGSEMPVIRYTSVQRVQFTTGVNGAPKDGNTMVIFPGMLQRSYVLPSGWTGTPPAYPITSWGPSNKIPEFDSLNADFTECRVTACHIRGEYIHNTFNDQGRMSIKMFQTEGVTVAQLPSDVSDRAAVEKYFPVKHGFSCFALPTDLTHRVFRNLTDESSEAHEAWGAVWLGVSGADDDAAVLEIVVTREIELLPQQSTFLSRMVAPAPPLDTGAMQSISQTHHAIRAHDKVITRGPQESALDHVEDALTTIGKISGVGAAAVGTKLAYSRFTANPSFAGAEALAGDAGVLVGDAALLGV